MPIASPFAVAQAESNATCVERFGVLLPERFGDPEAEYRAIRERAGLLDMSFRGLLALTGGERLRWLNGQITAEAKALRPGEGLLAAALTVKGRILADLVVYGRADSVWIDLPRHRADAVRESFERHIIADDVAVAELSDQVGHLMIAGPAAPSCLAGTLGEAATALRPRQHRDVSLAGAAVTLIASDRLKVPGFDLFCPAEAAGAVWRALAAAGAAPVGMAALDSLRLEAGWPWCGVDFGEDNLLLEALSPAHVSFTKGCYLGQEVVIRIEHQGHLNKKLCGLALDGTAVPPPGASIRSGERPVGAVTSAGWSPALLHPVALGYVRRELWEPGTALAVVWSDGLATATVAALPFVAGSPGSGEIRQA